MSNSILLTLFLKNRNNFKLIKFYRFKKSANLVKVVCTSSFCILFFSTISLVLRKINFSKIKEIPGDFDNALELDYNLIYYSKKSQEILRFSFIDNTHQSYYLPLEHELVAVDACSKKKYIVAITKNRNLSNSCAVVFWVWNNSQFLYIFDVKKSIRGIKILDQNRLVVFGKNSLKLFDNMKIEFTMNIEFEEEIKELFFYGQNQLMIKFTDKGFYLVDVTSKDKQRIQKYGRKSHLVYMDGFRTMIEVVDVHTMCKVLL